MSPRYLVKLKTTQQQQTNRMHTAVRYFEPVVPNFRRKLFFF